VSPDNQIADAELPDHAGVAFRPPIMLAVLLLVGLGLRFLAPLAFISSRVGFILGIGVITAAFSFFFWAVFTMRRGGGSIPTNEPTDTIVNSGPYRYSRNPIYLSMVVLLVGVALVSNSLWFVVLAAVAMVLLSWGVISREEIYLERKLGVEYASYKAAVRRWL
jgi:protein-S-isoprenylcysteine O-methyltransferase Ste14